MEPNELNREQRRILDALQRRATRGDLQAKKQLRALVQQWRGKKPTTEK